MSIYILLMSIIGYLIGSWSPGELIARFHGIDITNRGSGGTGATNVARLLGAQYFVLIFLIDCFKAFGYLKLLQSAHYNADVQACAALALLLGNTFSVFLNFKGGKGIATGFGILLALAGSTLPILVGVWAIAFYVTKTIGLASVAALAGLFFYALLLSFNAPQLALVLAIIALIGLWRHIDNVRRYLYSA